MFDNMSDIEFRGGVCGGTRWNIPATTPFGFSPCPNLETIDWDMKGIFSKSIDVHENDARVIPDGQIMDSSLHTLVGMGAMEDWRQTFNVHGGGGGRTNHQSQIQLQEHTITMSPRLSNNLHDTRHENSSLRQQFKPFNSLEESNINNTTTPQHDMTFGTPNNISYGLSSELLQTLFEDDDEDLVHAIFENQLLPINYPCTNNSRPIPKRPFDPSGLISDQAPPLWNSSSVASLNDIRANNFFPKVTANKVATEVYRGPSWSSSTVKKNQCDRPPLKRSKIETPSPLPSFKVRKEKLGDRITALQQLVSPFGKTDTASVLHEAIDYIKFLHNQVNQVLSRPYSKNRNDKNTTHESSYVVGEGDGNNLNQDLKSRGLCLVPLSSTIPVAIETTRAADFWTPNFGVGFRS